MDNLNIIYEVLSTNYPSAEYQCTDGIITKWSCVGVECPTQDDITKLVDQFIANSKIHPDDVGYNWYTLRQKHYPSTEQQLDLLYHDGIDAWKSAIKSVKDRYPKPADDGIVINVNPDALPT